MTAPIHDPDELDDYGDDYVRLGDRAAAVLAAAMGLVAFMLAVAWVFVGCG